MKWKQWLWGFAALPFIGLPLIAQETKPPEPVSQAPAPATEAQPAATPAPPAPAADSPEPVSTEEQRPADEKISADNNLSFPVDI
jgi:hypothetical protein